MTGLPTCGCCYTRGAASLIFLSSGLPHSFLHVYQRNSVGKHAALFSLWRCVCMCMLAVEALTYRRISSLKSRVSME